jgi:hypothetical protein
MVSREKAQESDQIKRIRDKLERQVEKETALFTPEALAVAQDKIYRWLERNSRERINLRERNIAMYSLFDKNEHSAKTSSTFVNKLKSQLTASISEEKAEIERKVDLKGRIKYIEPSQE